MFSLVTNACVCCVGKANAIHQPILNTSLIFFNFPKTKIDFENYKKNVRSVETWLSVRRVYVKVYIFSNLYNIAI